MVATETDKIDHVEPDSPAMTTSVDPRNDHETDEYNINYMFSGLGSQSSIYSLTLDEFQHALSENGKNFGSMNMDEFPNSIWTAEENQAPNDTMAACSTSRGMIDKQPSLPRQGSLTLPSPLCRKTVDEVWTQIQRTHQSEDVQQQNQQQQMGYSTSGSTQRQPTFGEMTLEDFLIKAGVVREHPNLATTQTPLPPHQFGFSAPDTNATFATRPMFAKTSGGVAYQPMPTTAGERSRIGNRKSDEGYATVMMRPSVGFYAPGTRLSPVSPVSPEEMCGRGQYEADMPIFRGRKGIIDGPVEKVVERRQRRMIKNRESAARSRARKQVSLSAYSNNSITFPQR